MFLFCVELAKNKISVSISVSVSLFLQEKVRDDDIIEIAQTLECQSNHKMQFTLGLLCLQALLILFGAFLALQTRKVGKEKKKGGGGGGEKKA